jgi:hypothetical protein
MTRLLRLLADAAVLASLTVSRLAREVDGNSWLGAS